MIMIKEGVKARMTDWVSEITEFCARLHNDVVDRQTTVPRPASFSFNDDAMNPVRQSSKHPVPVGTFKTFGRRQNSVDFLLGNSDDLYDRFADGGRWLRFKIELQTLAGGVDVRCL